LKGYEGKKEADKAKSFVEFYGQDYVEKETGLKMIGKNLEPLNRAFEAHLKNIVHACAQVTIVDWNGKVIYEKYVNGFDTDVEWTSGLYSGIPQDFYKNKSANFHKLLNGTKIPDSMFDSYANIKAEVLRLLTQVHNSQTIGIGGKPLKCETIVVGHNLIKSDIPSLEIDIMDRRFINFNDHNYGKVLYRD